MRIPCCHCGPRGHEEFAYLGDADVARPAWSQPSADEPMDAAQTKAWDAYVHLRDNPAGPHRELWQHVAGCRAWLVVTRDTRTHAISAVEPARAAASAGQAAS